MSEIMAAALRRIAEATPESVNAQTADRMCAWTRAVAHVALTDAEQEDDTPDLFGDDSRTARHKNEPTP